MLVLKDVLDLVQNLVLLGGRVPTRQVHYRQYQVVTVDRNLSMALAPPSDVAPLGRAKLFLQ